MAAVYQYNELSMREGSQFCEGISSRGGPEMGMNDYNGAVPEGGETEGAVGTEHVPEVRDEAAVAAATDENPADAPQNEAAENNPPRHEEEEEASPKAEPTQEKVEGEAEELMQQPRAGHKEAEQEPPKIDSAADAEPAAVEVKVEEEDEAVEKNQARKPEPVDSAAEEDAAHGLPEDESKNTAKGEATSVIEIATFHKRETGNLENAIESPATAAPTNVVKSPPLASEAFPVQSLSRRLDNSGEIKPGHLMKTPYAKSTSRDHTPDRISYPSRLGDGVHRGELMRFQNEKELEDYKVFEGTNAVVLRNAVKEKEDIPPKNPSAWLPSLASIKTFFGWIRERENARAQNKTS